MSIEEIFVSIISLLVGIVVSIIVSRYYFKKSSNISLTPYFMFRTELFSDIDPDVKNDLIIKYKDSGIDELTQIFYKIENTGDTAINDISEPLNLTLSNGHILDVFVKNISPVNRSIKVEVNKKLNKINFIFPFLNKRESFSFKLLLKGSVNPRDLKFSITACGLPPVLESVDVIEEKNSKRITNPFVILIFIIVVLSLSVSAVLIPISEVDINSFVLNKNESLEYNILIFITSLSVKQILSVFVLLLELLIKLVFLATGVFLFMVSLSNNPKKFFTNSNKRKD